MSDERGLGSGKWDRRMDWNGLALGFRTDLLDNGLTESLTHGARDFLGVCGQAVEGEGGKGRGRGRSVGRSVCLWCWVLRRGVARRRGRKVEVEVGAEEEARRKARQGKVRKAGGQDQTRGPGSARQGKARRGEVR